MNFLGLLAAVQSSYVDYSLGGTTKFIVFTICNLLALFAITRAIRYPHVGPKMPFPFASLFNNPSVPAFLAAMSAGHILGILTILTVQSVHPA